MQLIGASGLYGVRRRIRPDSSPFPERFGGGFGPPQPHHLPPSRPRNPTSPTVVGPASLEPIAAGSVRERILGHLAQRDHSRDGVVLRRARDRFRSTRGAPPGVRKRDEPPPGSPPPPHRVYPRRRRTRSLCPH